MILIARMPSRSAGRAGLRATIAIDVVLLAPRGGELAVFAPQQERGRRALPHGAPRSGESLDAAAATRKMEALLAKPSRDLRRLLGDWAKRHRVALG